MFPRGIKDVFRCGILSASHQLCLAKTFALPRSQLWFPVMLPDIHTLDKPREHDTKIKSGDATLDWILSWTPKCVNLKTQATAVKGSQSGSPAAPLPVSFLYQFNGIPTMSAITSGLEKPTKGFNVLLQENTEQEMQLVERKEDKKTF